MEMVPRCLKVRVRESELGGTAQEKKANFS